MGVAAYTVVLGPLGVEGPGPVACEAALDGAREGGCEGGCEETCRNIYSPCVTQGALHGRPGSERSQVVTLRNMVKDIQSLANVESCIVHAPSP